MFLTDGEVQGGIKQKVYLNSLLQMKKMMLIESKEIKLNLGNVVT
ncbi:hypothetical protein U722_03230 [Bacillus amyloliquefaciens LFB112]|nr:hypothetical protein U722_03230 [Bacillus amyloliquefaciens LFB112]